MTRKNNRSAGRPAKTRSEPARPPDGFYGAWREPGDKPVAPRAERRNRTHRLSANMPKVLNPSMRRHGFASADIVRHWEDLVGPQLSKVAQPLRITSAGSKEGAGCLILRVAGAAAPLIDHESPRILERVNAYYGYLAVDRLSLVQGLKLDPTRRTSHGRAQAPEAAPTPPLSQADEAALKDRLQTVSDPALQKVLEELGRQALKNPRP